MRSRRCCFQVNAGRAYSSRYETVCKALGYSDQYISETEHLHSSSQPRADSSIRSSEDRRSNSESRSFYSARESPDGATGWRPDPPIFLPSGHIDGPAYLRAWSQLGKQALTRNVHDDSAHREQAENKNADPQRPKRMIPDRSARPLGYFSEGDSSESPPATQSSKRAPPDSPPAQSQPNNPTRRHQHKGERPSREEIGSSSRPERKTSHKRRDRA